MNSNLYLCLKLSKLGVALAAVLLFVTPAFSQQDGSKPKSRDIVPVFETVRPAVKAVKKKRRRKKAKRYKRITSRKNSGRISRKNRPGKTRITPPQENIAVTQARQIGITLWQMKEIRSSRDLEVFVEANSGRTRYLQPQRVSVDTVFAPYSKIRFTVESSRTGYLYVIDQELRTDGTLGDAYLIFPNKRIRSGTNFVRPGGPIELPDVDGNPSYFELRPENPDGDSLTAELLTVIITDRPIPNLKIGMAPIVISEAKLNSWRTKWSGGVEVFESEDSGLGSYTKRERQAAGGKATLNSADPLPQTVFMVEGNRNRGSLITVPIWYGNE